MAFSYLTDTQRKSISSILDNVHVTFARTITAFKNGEIVSLATNSEYNSFYKRRAANTEFTEVSQDFLARIRYVKAEEEMFKFNDGNADQNSQHKIVLPAGSVKIKVDKNAHEFIRGAKRIELDGQRFSIISNARQIAMFGPEYSPYYEYILVPTED